MVASGLLKFNITASQSIIIEHQGTILRLLLCSNQFLKQEAGSCVDIKKFAASKVCHDPL